MANKKVPAKKTVKKPTQKAKPTSKVPPLYKPRNPEMHKITGRFVGLYVMFAFTAIAFAAMTVWLYIFSVEMLNRYEEIDPACRIGNCEHIQRDINGYDTED